MHGVIINIKYLYPLKSLVKHRVLGVFFWHPRCILLARDTQVNRHVFMYKTRHFRKPSYALHVCFFNFDSFVGSQYIEFQLAVLPTAITSHYSLADFVGTFVLLSSKKYACVLHHAIHNYLKISCLLLMLAKEMRKE